MSFKAIFGDDNGVSYSRKLVDQIRSHREKLDGSLFLDKLLVNMNIKDGLSIYPPKTNGDLRTLFDLVSSSTSPSHHKNSISYYVLLDLALPRLSPESFAVEASLPHRYRTLMDGFWALDRLDFSRALDSLTSPSLIPTFPDETLHVLCKNAKDEEGREYVLGYFEANSPEVRSQQVLDEVYEVMCSANVTEAFFYARLQGGQSHRRILEILFRNVISRRHGIERADRATELVGLPLSREEETWFTEYFTVGKGKSLDGAKDIILARSLSIGDFSRARELSESNGGKNVNGMTWKNLLKNPN